MIMKKRITLKDWEYIGKYNPIKKGFRHFGSYSLVKTDRGFRREVKVNLLAYLVLFIPLHIVKLIICMFDGGLKEFEIERRNIGFDRLEEHGENYTAYPKAKEIWEKY